MTMTTTTTIEEHFETLARQLKGFPIKREDRSVDYNASPNEFMFMGIAPDGVVQFKHHHTRNYVFLVNGKLQVPVTNKAFLLGIF